MANSDHKKKNKPNRFKLPIWHMVAIIIGAAISELLTMYVLDLMPMHNEVLKGYLDALLLLILLTPLLYLLVLRPMNNYVEDCRKAKEELFESKEHYRALTDSGAALIWRTNPEGKCMFLNKTWLNFTGRSLNEELGTGWMDGVHPDDLKAYINNFKLAFELRERCSLKYRLRHVSGEYRWIQTNATPTYTSKGEFTGYIGHCLDIHEHQMAQ